MKTTRREILSIIREELSQPSRMSEAAVRTRAGDPWEYSIVSNRWHTRRKGSSTRWIDLEPPDDKSKRKKFNSTVLILNREFPQDSPDEESTVTYGPGSDVESMEVDEEEVEVVHPENGGGDAPENGGGDAPGDDEYDEEYEEEIVVSDDEEAVTIPDDDKYRDLAGIRTVVLSAGAEMLRKMANQGRGVLTVGESGPAAYAVRQLLAAYQSHVGTYRFPWGDAHSKANPALSEYDDELETAVESYQSYLGLGIDGEVGPKTSAALLGYPSSKWAGTQASWRVDRREAQEQLLDRLEELIGSPVEILRVPKQNTSISAISRSLQGAGIRNKNILAGILGNIESEAGGSPNISAMGDDAARVDAGESLSSSDIDNIPDEELKKPIPATGPKRPPSLYRSFGLVQWNVMGGAGETYLRQLGLDAVTSSPQDKLDAMLDLNNQTREIKRIAVQGDGIFRGWGRAVSEDPPFDDAAAARYAREWAIKFERCVHCKEGDPGVANRERQARETGAELFAESLHRRSGKWVIA